MNDGLELNVFVDRAGTPCASASIGPRPGKTRAYPLNPDEHELLP